MPGQAVRKEGFRPTWVGMLINPFYLARKALHREVVGISDQVAGRVLDVGCGQKPYAQLFSCEEYVGLELDTPANRKTKIADIYYDGDRFPLDDGRFDWVLTSQVLEHVFEPDNFIREIGRVLRPEGHLFLTVPFLWDEHEQPFDYARYSSFGLRYLLERNGFEILRQSKTAAGAETVFQLINVYLYKALMTRFTFSNRAVQLLLIAPFNVLGRILGRVLPGNEDLYLDNVVLARKGAP
jgi:SAM-dependent methyltransferase